MGDSRVHYRAYIFQNVMVDGTKENPIFMDKSDLMAALFNMFNNGMPNAFIHVYDCDDSSDKRSFDNNYKEDFSKTVSKFVEFYSPKNKLPFWAYSSDKSRVDAFKALYTAISDIYNIHPKTYESNAELMQFDLDERKYYPAPKPIQKVVKDAVAHYGILSDYDVVNNGIARFVVLIPEEIIPTIKDLGFEYDATLYSDPTLKSEPETTERFNELFIRSLLKVRKCKALQEKMTPYNSLDVDFFSDVIGEVSI